MGDNQQIDDSGRPAEAVAGEVFAGLFSAAGRANPYRREQPSLSFGGGVRYCLGAPLARLEASVAFPALLSRYPRLSLAGTPVGRSGVGFRGHARLPVSTG